MTPRIRRIFVAPARLRALELRCRELEVQAASLEIRLRVARDRQAEAEHDRRVAEEHNAHLRRENASLVAEIFRPTERRVTTTHKGRTDSDSEGNSDR